MATTTPFEKGFFDEAPGQRSSIRMMSFVSLLAAIALAVLTIYTKNADGLFLVAMFIVGAFAPKAVQKFAEVAPARV